MKENCLFYMGKPWLTDWFGGVHARNVRFLGVWMPVRDALDRLPEAVQLMQTGVN